MSPVSWSTRHIERGQLRVAISMVLMVALSGCGKEAPTFFATTEHVCKKCSRTTTSESVPASAPSKTTNFVTCEACMDRESERQGDKPLSQQHVAPPPPPTANVRPAAPPPEDPPDHVIIGKEKVYLSANTASLSWVKDAELDSVAKLKELIDLRIAIYDMEDVTVDGFAKLTTLPKVRVLQIMGPQVPGKGISNGCIAELAKMTQLVELDLGMQCRITDQCFASLCTLTRLQKLSLQFCSSIRAEGCSKLSPLTSLETLDLSYCPVSDRGLQELSQLLSLRRLHLREAPVTDQGIQQLAALKNLRELDLSHCKKLTAEGMARLSTSLPDCTIQSPK